ncbi:DsbA family oxidoreductase [Alkalicaulis satelles]|uniref:DsbA family oxidoreductase n=1 Tax=Alkalicaulis satelles TaxID=2609175 RepID=A0A5M6ZHE2_9PROT|nr:DsbA family oxidoreductase [Alkalicaulis satelles]KAA5803710.1 DsbA family oxidoreductase [Alkalicaulis satelles]
MNAAPVSVDLVTDPVCPWCWLGLRYWRQARALAPEIETETILRPFQLDAAVPRGGLPYRDYMARKVASAGAAERFSAMRAHLEQAGPQAGIVFNFDSIETRPNTLDAHRLVRWAQGQGLGEAALDLIHKAFFEDRRDIGDADVLVEIAGEAGLDADTVRDLLATDRDSAEVQREEQFYRSLGVQGVPCFIFNGRFAVSGAEAPDVLADAIRKAAKTPAAGED